jgi:hypothetical protein
MSDEQKTLLETVPAIHRQAVAKTVSPAPTPLMQFQRANRSTKPHKVLPREAACACCLEGGCPCLVYDCNSQAVFGGWKGEMFNGCETCVHRGVPCAFARHIVKASPAKPKPKGKEMETTKDKPDTSRKIKPLPKSKCILPRPLSQPASQPKWSKWAAMADADEGQQLVDELNGMWDESDEEGPDMPAPPAMSANSQDDLEEDDIEEDEFEEVPISV